MPNPNRNDTPVKKPVPPQKTEYSVSDIMAYLKNMQIGHDSKLTNIQSELSQYNVKFEVLLSKIDNLSSEVLALKNENITLKADVESLQLKIKDLESKPISFQSLAPVDIVKESEERISRNRNLLFFNVSDNVNETPDNLSQTINSLLHILSVSVSISKIIRIGKIGSKPRPILVELSSTQDVHSVLKCKSKLNNSAQWKHVGISTDMTQYQRSVLFEMKSIINSKKSTGEQGWFIKYVNGCPQLSKKN